jgi:L,D-transpeptidase catalytic domain
MRKTLTLLTLLLALPGIAAALPFWGAKESSQPETPPMALKPGEFVWSPGIAPAGPIVVVVSLDDQLAFVYRNGVEIGYSTVSSGKAGHGTPTGVFTILQKDRDHHSSKYNNASMPYTQRLTWDGVALHAGGLPGYPSSHGCVHLPSVFAEELFSVSPMGMTVVVVDARTAPVEVVKAPAVAPVNPVTGQAEVASRLGENENFRWQPEKSPTGPVSLIMSAADERVIVLRNGIEIGRAKLHVTDPLKPLGAHAFIVGQGEGQGQSVLVAGAPARNWIAVSLPGYAGATGTDLASVVGTRVRMPQAFASEVYPLLVAGTTLVVLDAPILAQNTGLGMTVLANGAPAVGAP